MTDAKWTEKLEREYQEDCIRVGFLRINDSHRQIYLLARLRSEEEVKGERTRVLNEMIGWVRYVGEKGVEFWSTGSKFLVDTIKQEIQRISGATKP